MMQLNLSPSRTARRAHSLDTYRAVEARVAQETSVLRVSLEAAERASAALAVRLEESRAREVRLRQAITELALELGQARSTHERVLRDCEDPRVVAFLEWCDTERKRVTSELREYVVARGRSPRSGTPAVVTTTNHTAIKHVLAVLSTVRAEATNELPFVPAPQLDERIAALKASVPSVDEAEKLVGVEA